MGRRSANLKVVGASPSHARRPRGDNADGAATVRNVVPWQEMERRVAERIAAKAARNGDLPPWKTHDIEKAPDSGVRASERNMAAANQNLSFTVYSVEELDARPRTSAPPPAVVVVPSRWPDVWKSTKTVARVFIAWLRTPKPRSRMMDVCGIALRTLRADLFAALATLPWKKIALRGAIGLGTFFVLLFGVLAIADLTDDVKPGRSRGVSNAVKVALPHTTPVIAPVIELAADPAPAIEIDDVPMSAKKAVVKKSVAKKKKKGTEPFIP